MTSLLPRRRSTLSLLAAGLAIFGLLGLRAATAASPARAGSAATKTVTIERFDYKPSPLKVDPGTKIVFDNEDGGITHTATANNGAFDTGNIKAGDKKAIVLRKPGVYKYYCSIHTFMHGKIIVK